MRALTRHKARLRGLGIAAVARGEFALTAIKKRIPLVKTDTAIDWRAWMGRWDRQQGGYLPDREERFALMLDYVARQRGEGPLRLLDLCCGPGSISARALARFPEATVVAVDLDPWLLTLGRETFGRDWPGRITWVEGDLRDDGWLADLAPDSFDAVLSATALHWFHAAELVPVYQKVAGLLAAGGIFLNADHFPLGEPTLDGLIGDAEVAMQAANFAQPGAEDWAAFWAAVGAEPAFAELVAERERRFSYRSPVSKPRVAFHHEALRAVGFRETGELWRQRRDAILAAVRGES